MADNQYTIDKMNQLIDWVDEKSIMSDSVIDRLDRFLRSKHFMSEIWAPSKVGIDPNSLKQSTMDMYIGLNRREMLKYLANTILYNGPERYNRSAAAFLANVCDVGIKASQERENRFQDAKASGKYTHSELRDEADDINMMNEALAKLIKAYKKILKPLGRDMERLVYLPRPLCIACLHQMPDPELVGTYQVGFYANRILNAIYQYFDVYDDPFYDFDNVKWKKFFTVLFGEENVSEVAVFILLEGMSKLDKYKSRMVRNAWNSLTAFALRELNSAPKAIQEKMINLYIQRIEQMFKNNTYDVRADLRSISKLQYPELWDTLKNYVSKITEVIEQSKKE